MSRLWTYEDYWRYTPPDTFGCEVVDGELIVTPNPSPDHQLVVGEVLMLLYRFDRDLKLGRCCGRVDVRLDDHNVVSPDLLFVSRDRRHLVGERCIEGAPDLVVEVFLDWRRGLPQEEARRQLYERFGVREHWLVDPDACTITVSSLEDGRYRPTVYREGDVVRTSLLPGLEVDLTALFAEAA